MSYPFTYIKLIPSYGFGHKLYWNLDSTFVTSSEDEYYLLTAYTPDFSVVEEERYIGRNVFTATDDSKEKQTFRKVIYYRIKLVSQNGNTYISNTLAFTDDKYSRREYVMAREILRKEILRAAKFTGSQMFLLKRRILGIEQKFNEAPDIDPITGIRLSLQSTSEGTRYEYGYFNPIPIVLSYEDMETERNKSRDGFGVLELAYQNFRAPGYPAIETFDIIVDAANDMRFMVKKQKDYTFPSTDLPIVQELQTQLIPNTDPIYKLKVP